MPEGLRTVGDDFLSNFSRLVSIILPEGLRTVGNYFLYGCSRLVSVNVPEGLRTVGKGFLDNCTGLREMSIKKELFEEIQRSNKFGTLPNDVKITYV